jgi:spermidine synthase
MSSVVLERRMTDHGELALRRVDGQLELILNGVFLMSTRGGSSERALVRATLAARRRTRMLLGGLGVGFSLAEALASQRVSEVVVVEAEADVIAWGRTHFRPYNGGALNDPRVTVVRGDVAEYIAACRSGFDAICLDTDNGPDWLVRPANSRLYSLPGLRRLRDLLWNGGRLAIWAARESPVFAARLTEVFAGAVHAERIPVERGPADLVYVAHRR